MGEKVFGEYLAGYRSTELRRGDVVFAWQSGIAVAMAGIDQTARHVAADGEKLDAAGLAFQMSRLYAEYNRVHPFREGNGRTGTLMLHTLAMLCGRRLDLPPSPATSGTRPRGTACRFAATATPITGRSYRFSSGRGANSSSPCGIGLHTPPGSV